MKVVLPVAGESTRFPGMKPKWLLTHPNGNLMFHEALVGLDLTIVDEIIIICLQSHLAKYDADKLVERQFAVSELDVPYRLIAIEDTDSQAQTVSLGLRKLNINGPVLVKDADNQFKCPVTADNAVATMNLSQAGRIESANKSYVEVDSYGRVVNIVEKHVISNTFCVGGYFFAEAAEFLKAYDAIHHHQGLYISHVIYYMLSQGAAFDTIEVSDFSDWGTLEDWNDFKCRFATLFVDLDGTIVKNAGQFSSPGWGETGPISESLAALNKLHDSGCVQIIITTSRKEIARQATEEQLQRIGLKYHQIIFDLHHARRILINDYAHTNPYRSAESVNIPRDSDALADMLKGFFKDL